MKGECSEKNCTDLKSSKVSASHQKYVFMKLLFIYALWVFEVTALHVCEFY